MDTNLKRTFIFNILIPENFIDDLKRYDGKVFQFFNRDIVVSGTFLTEKEIKDEEVQKFYNDFIKSLMFQEGVIIVDEQEIDKEIRNIVFLLNNGGDNNNYLFWLVRLFWSIRQGQYEKTGASKLVEYKTDENHRLFVFYFSTNPSLISNELHVESINKIRVKRIENMGKQRKNRIRTPIDHRLRHEVFKKNNYTCVECGNTNKNSVLHVDHIVSVLQGGSDELSNLQTLCEKCNLAKSSKSWNGKNNEKEVSNGI